VWERGREIVRQHGQPSARFVGGVPPRFVVGRSRFLSSTRFITNGTHGATDYDVCVKTILIGDSGSGKSSLLYRYTESDWSPNFIATIGVDFKVLTFERQSKVIKLQIWDTAGQDRFRSITHSYYRGAHGVMVVFDVTNAESFEGIASWMADVHKFGIEGTPMVLVGNKCDLESKRQVTRAQAQALADSLGCRYCETSAKDNLNVDDTFAHIVDECVQRRTKLVDDKKRLRPTTNLGGTPPTKRADGCPC